MGCHAQRVPGEDRRIVHDGQRGQDHAPDRLSGTTAPIEPVRRSTELAYPDQPRERRNLLDGLRDTDPLLSVRGLPITEAYAGFGI